MNEDTAPDEPMQVFTDLMNRSGDLAAEIHTATVARNIERLQELHGAMARSLARELDDDQRRQWEAFWADLIASSSDVLLDNLAVLIGDTPEADRFLSAQWLADRIWRKRIYHANPTTRGMIRALIASSGRSQILEVWQPEAIILAVGDAGILRLPLRECARRIGTAAYQHFEHMIWEEVRGIPRQVAEEQVELPEPDLAAGVLVCLPGILDALIAEESARNVVSLLDSPKFASKMKAYLHTELDILRDNPNLSDRDRLLAICARMGISEDNAYRIRSRIKNTSKKTVRK